MSLLIQQFAQWSWYNSLAAAVLAVGLVVLRGTLRQKVPAGWFCLAGWIVVARLFLPAPLPSEWAWDHAWTSTLALPAASSDAVTAPIPQPPPAIATETDKSFRVVPSPPTPAATSNQRIRACEWGAAPTQPTPAATSSPVGQPTDAAPRFQFDWLMGATLVWAVGALVSLGITIACHWRFVRWLRRKARPLGEPCGAIAAECARIVGLRRVPALLTVPGGGSPFLCGLLRPAIVLSTETLAVLSPTEIRHVLLHEMLHVASRDLAANWFLAAARILHWWNPLVHLTARHLLADREMRRDAQAIALMHDPEGATGYGNTLLKLAFPVSSVAAPTPGFVTLFHSEREIKQRIIMIAKPNHRSRLVTAIATAAAVAFSVPVFTTARGQEEPAVTPPPPVATTPEQPELAGFALIPAGEFIMGDTFGESPAKEKEGPPHKVSVSAFHILKTEVTKAQWDAVRAWGLTHGYPDLPEGKAKGPHHPVQTVSWHAAVKWCNAKSEMEGLIPYYYMDTAKTGPYRSGEKDMTNEKVMWSANGYRLPTEAEWEKAARGGLAGKRLPLGDTISHAQANFNNAGKELYQTGSIGYHASYTPHGEPFTAPVASFPANGYGLYDMDGNLHEWCWDSYANYQAGPQTEPRGSEASESRRGRVFRGGAWNSTAAGCRVSYRGCGGWDVMVNDIGFRVVR